MHASNAASLGFFDVGESEFCQNVIRELGMDPDQLPEVTEEFQVLGEYRGIPVTVALGDNQASFGSFGR